MTGVGEGLDYAIDNGESETYQACRKEYGRYVSTGNVTAYSTKLTDEENETANSVYTQLSDYLNQTVPAMIKNGVDSSWDEYVEKVQSFDTDSVCAIYQKYVDEAHGK